MAVNNHRSRGQASSSSCHEAGSLPHMLAMNSRQSGPANATSTFCCQFACPGYRPLRQQAGVYQAIVPFDMAQGLVTQPVEKFVTVRRSKQFIEGIALAPLAETFSGHQQGEVMIAQNSDRR